MHRRCEEPWCCIGSHHVMYEDAYTVERMLTMNTLRLLYPEWQAGDKKGYYLGAQLLATLAPGGDHQRMRQVPVMMPTGTRYGVG